MLFGMGIELTEVDDRHLKQVVESAYAALGLANDFFLFDKDFAEYLEQTNMNEPQQTSMTNSVWSCMGWHNLTAEEAKIFVRDKIIRQEQDFAVRKQAFIRSQQSPDRPNSAWTGSPR